MDLTGASSDAEPTGVGATSTPYDVAPTRGEGGSHTTDTDVDVSVLRLVLVRLARRIRQRSGIGLTPSQLSALSTVERRGHIRLSDLASRERISRSTVTRLVAKLEARGCVTRTPDAGDGRSAVVALSDEGRRVLTEARERADSYLAEQIALLSDDERRQLAAVLPVLERLLEPRA
jgi:DNA-binding MarR family transcriptional regulator